MAEYDAKLNNFFRRLSFYKPCNLLWRFVNRKKSQCQFLYQFREISPLSPFGVSSEKYQNVLPNAIVKSVIFINNQKVRTFFPSETCYDVLSIAKKPKVNFFITRNFGRFPCWVLLIFVVWKIQVLVPNSKVRLVISINTNQKVHIVLLSITS